MRSYGTLPKGSLSSPTGMHSPALPSRPRRCLYYCAPEWSADSCQGLPFDFCLNPEKGLPLPDLTLYFSLPPDVASSRAAYGAERYESVEIQELVRAQFELVASEVRKKHCERQWVEVDASESIDEVAEHVWNAVEPLLTVHLGTIETLWS